MVSNRPLVLGLRSSVMLFSLLVSFKVRLIMLCLFIPLLQAALFFFFMLMIWSSPEMIDLGPLRYFLGLEIARSSRGILISQQKYTADILSRAALSDSRTAATPIELNQKFCPDDGEPLSDVTRYRTLVGSLIYLTISRPNIAYAVHVVSQFVAAPRTTHYAAVLRILRYLRGTLSRSLFLPSSLLLSSCVPILMLIGLPMSLIANLSLVIAFFLAIHLFLGVPRNNILSHAPLQSPSIVLWPTLLLRLFGFAAYLLIWEFHFWILLLCIVTTRVPFISVQIQSFMSVPNILRSIVI
ncbi:uncharacterized protein LOC130140228 [Syzygium oleosum]|uniref:uncharacterized protein LOC130140228 n=1 Tax=Syzygium oleosum TaxID=219896 RepID=UPI0024BBD0F9|nr:uncharacterized protein LOC130140228 [Syzygium oleosum]